ncbi:TIGR01212 family radical SAM protein [bacterium]|nr:TIGR01212 family radical SAM protein [bacterium]
MSKRYRALNPALRELFGGRTRRIALDAGFTCPTRDGTLGVGGCRYCDAGGGRAWSVDPEEPVREQLRRGIERSLARDPKTTRFIAYFQAFTNTYAPPDRLRRIYEEGLSDPRVVAMAIGTRPDCLAPETLDVLGGFSRRTFLWVELGLQSIRNETLAAMDRGHSVERFVEAAHALREREIRLCAHVILGLPGDGTEDMLASASLLNDLGVWGVKLHNLYIHRNSRLAHDYREGRLSLLTREEYLHLVIEYLSYLRENILIHRLIGEAPGNRLLAPEWARKKQDFLARLDREMDRTDVHQGDLSGIDGRLSG